MEQVRTHVMCIGNELLSGKTVNTNLSYLGQELEKIGLPIVGSTVTSDEEEELNLNLSFAFDTSDIIITTGGLGPTADDITKKCVADYLHKELQFNDEIWENIVARFARRGMVAPDTNRTQAYVPKDFTILKNKLGTAPGLYYDLGDKVVVLLPGVPYEMKGLFEDIVKDLLKERFNRNSVVSRSVHTIGVSESKLAEIIADIITPNGISLAFLPQPGRVTLRLTGTDVERIEEIISEFKRRLSDSIWGEDDETLPLIIHRLLSEHKLSLAVAESCTGGLVQEKLVSIPGASNYLKGGIVSYSDEAKREQLGVRASTLEKYGAVSKEAAKEMAEGVLKKFNADIGVSVTGIAGPDGGTEEKPVGTVWFGVSINERLFADEKETEEGTRTHTETRFLIGSRYTIRESSAHVLLNLLRIQLKNIGIL